MIAARDTCKNAGRTDRAMRRLASAVRWEMLILLAPLQLLFSPFTIIDDAYISFRYAFNLAHGHGLVYNLGERVQGMTNLLWTLILAVPIAAGLPVEPVAVGLGIAFGLLAIMDTWRLCRHLGVTCWPAWGAIVVLGLYPGYWRTVASGLEGGLFAFLLMRTLLAVNSSAPAYVAGLWGGLLFMTRPESIVVIPLCALYMLVALEYRTLPRWSIVWRRVMPLLVAWLAVITAVSAWRLAYFGAVLPNTIIAKSVPLSTPVILANIRLGLLYWRDFLATSLPLAVGTVLAPLLASRMAAVWLCLAVIGAQVPVILLNGGDWMPHYRLLAIYAPVQGVLLGVMLEHVIRLDGWRARRLRPVIVYGAILLLALGAASTLRNDDWTSPLSQRDKGWMTCYESLAYALQPTLIPGDRVTPEAIGIFSYILSDVYIHDMMGLTDAYLAHQGNIYQRWYGKSDYAYTYRQVAPNIFVFHSGFDHLSQFELASGGRYNDEYETYDLHTSPPCHPMNISIRSDSVDRIVPALGGNLERVTVPALNGLSR
jgi:arabinofuranosyltransferase